MVQQHVGTDNRAIGLIYFTVTLLFFFEYLIYKMNLAHLLPTSDASLQMLSVLNLFFGGGGFLLNCPTPKRVPAAYARFQISDAAGAPQRDVYVC